LQLLFTERLAGRQADEKLCAGRSVDEACNSHDVSYLQQPRISPEELRVMNWELGIASTGHRIARKSGCGFESARSSFSSQNWCLGNQSGIERERGGGGSLEF